MSLLVKSVSLDVSVDILFDIVFDVCDILALTVDSPNWDFFSEEFDGSAVAPFSSPVE